MDRRNANFWKTYLAKLETKKSLNNQVSLENWCVYKCLEGAIFGVWDILQSNGWLKMKACVDKQGPEKSVK